MSPSGGERPRTVGIGSMVVDRIHRTPRILARDEKGVLRDVEGAGPVRLYVGGVVLNHLGWARALGLRCGIFGRQADDDDGRFLRAGMDRLGIERHLALDGSASSVAEIFVDDEGARTIYMARGATAETTPEHIREVHAEFIAGAARVTTEISQLPLDATCEVVRIAQEADIPVVVDFDVPPSTALPTLGDAAALSEVLGGADVLKPSKVATAELFPDHEGDLLGLARAVRSRYGSRVVVLTDGERGCAICSEGFETLCPAASVRALDTTGAGDAFLGGLLVAMSLGLDWDATGRLANACGAACCEQLGAFPSAPGTARARALELYAELGGRPLELGADLPADRSPGSPKSSDADPAAEAAVRVLRAGADGLAALVAAERPSAWVAATDLIESAQKAGGRVHVTGVGKPEHVAHYGAAVLSSTGTPASFLHATEVLHGGLGQVVAGDVVIAISNSGETGELRRAVEALRGAGAKIVGITGALDSWLAGAAEVTLYAGVDREGGPLGLAPRASASTQVLVVAALSAALQERAGLTPAGYASRHPAGGLGDRARADAGRDGLS